MVYRFLAIADIHWGAMDSQTTYDNLQLVTRFIREMAGEIDFVVICGDYFDYRIQLNSKTALLAVQWFDELMTVCRETGVQKVRMFRGTREHDNDQMEIFRPTYEDDSGYFRLYNTTTSEELLPELKVIFCPDENINLLDYYDVYWDQFIPFPDIGFFHGNFSSILPSIEFNRIQEHHLPTMVYEYEVMSKLIRGPMIAGHWHIPQDNDSLFYVGSFDRWRFGEEEPKGFIYGAYDTKRSKYFIRRVENILARHYDTMIITDENCRYPADFSLLVDRIHGAIRANSTLQLRVVYMMSTDDEDLRKTLSVFQQQLSSMRQVKIEIKDLAKKEEKEHHRKDVEKKSQEYEYVFNRDVKAIPSIIQKFILDRKGETLPVEAIEKYIGKYLTNLGV